MDSNLQTGPLQTAPNSQVHKNTEIPGTEPSWEQAFKDSGLDFIVAMSLFAAFGVFAIWRFFKGDVVRPDHPDYYHDGHYRDDDYSGEQRHASTEHEDRSRQHFDLPRHARSGTGSPNRRSSSKSAKSARSSKAAKSRRQG